MHVAVLRQYRLSAGLAAGPNAASHSVWGASGVTVVDVDAKRFRRTRIFVVVVVLVVSVPLSGFRVASPPPPLTVLDVTTVFSHFSV